MADLKRGTTVGGNTIWTQGNLPLFPAGDLISYKGFKVYTSNDKPTALDLGFLPASGGIIGGNLDVQGYTTIKGGAVSGILLFTKPDTSIQFSTAVDKDTLSLNYSTAGNFGIWNTTKNKWSFYRTPTEQWIFDDINGVKINNTLNVVGDSTLATVNAGALTASTITTPGMIKSSAAIGLTVDSANAGIELGSITTVGTPFIDFHTSGTNLDYDVRLTANNTSVSLMSPVTLTYFNLQSTQYLRLHSGMTSAIMMGRNSTVLRDHYNGNVSLSASKRSDTENIGGDLFLGYNSGTVSFTNTVRLESPMTWKGVNNLVDVNGKLVSSSLDVAFLPLSGGTVDGNLIVTGNIGGSNVNGASLSTPGNLTVLGTSTLAGVTATAIVASGAASATEFTANNGVLRTKAQNSNANSHVWFVNENNVERALIWADTSNNLNIRCTGGSISFSAAKIVGVASLAMSGALTVNGGIGAGSGWITTTGRITGGETWSTGNLVAGNGSSIHASDGNISGSKWGGGWLADWIENRAAAWARQEGNNYVNYFTGSQNAWTVGHFLTGIYLGDGWIGLGVLVSGSTLRPSTTAGNYDPGTSFPGTWMCCGRAETNQRVTTWKRVA